MNLKGTKTERNLQEAFAGESMARNKYLHGGKVPGTVENLADAAEVCPVCDHEQSYFQLKPENY